MKQNEQEGLLMSVPATAKLIGIDKSKLLTMSEHNLAPKPLIVGKRLMYRRSDIQVWILKGCPTFADCKKGTRYIYTSGINKGFTFVTSSVIDPDQSESVLNKDAIKERAEHDAKVKEWNTKEEKRKKGVK